MSLPAPDPFGMTADPETYMPRAATERALAELERALLAGAFPVALTGPPGIGKTLLLRVVERKLAGRVHCVYVAYAALPAPELCRWILGLLGEAVPDTGDAEAALLAAAHGFAQAGTPLALLIDDASAIPPDSAERLGALAGGSRGALQIVAADIEDAGVGPWAARFGTRVERVQLETPMSASETALYIRARLQRGGVSPQDKSSLDAKVIDRIFRRSNGVPRAVQALASEFLRLGPAALPREALETLLAQDDAVHLADRVAASGRARDLLPFEPTRSPELPARPDPISKATPPLPGFLTTPPEREAPSAPTALGAIVPSRSTESQPRERAAPPAEVPGTSEVPPAARDASSSEPAERRESPPPMDPISEDAPTASAKGPAFSVPDPAATLSHVLPKSPPVARASPLSPPLRTTPPSPSTEPPARSLARRTSVPHPVVKPAPAAEAPALALRWSRILIAVLGLGAILALAIPLLRGTLAPRAPEMGSGSPPPSPAAQTQSVPPDAVPAEPPPAKEPVSSGTAPGESGPPASAGRAVPTVPNPPLSAPARHVAEPPVAPIPVHINATPWATIQVDGVDLGETPIARALLTPGSHVFRARMPDGRVDERTVEISAEARYVTLGGASAAPTDVPTTRTESAPPEAAPVEPPPKEPISAGTPPIESGPPASAEPAAPAGPNPPVSASAPQVAKAPIAAIPVHINATPWAAIQVDGVDLGETPIARALLAPGSHLFRARLPDGRVVERTVQISAETRYVTFQ